MREVSQVEAPLPSRHNPAVANRRIELTWVCTSCQRQNLGRNKVCEGCGNPKDASEHFEMPGDTRAVASVTDPALLRAAAAGADWRCPFCRADNTALNVVCKQCGAERGATPANRPAPRVGVALASATLAAPSRPWPLGRMLLAVVLPFALGVPCLLGVVLFSANRSPPAPYVPPTSSIGSAHVQARAWQTTRIAMRHRLVEQEGFAEQEPADAIDVTADGVRHHHDDQVEDGTEQQAYTEDVPYQDTETYTESVPCGDDCTTIPQTCHEVCEDEGNGFASCHDECSGGGQSCTPRTCSETRTRTVTRTRPEARTRTVPHYRAVPRDAPWFRWRTWAWVSDRRATHTGTSEAPTWPSDEELGAGAPLGDGEEERIDTSATWSVTVRDDAGRSLPWMPPNLDDLARFPVGAAVAVEIDPYGNLARVLDAADAGTMDGP